MDKNAVIQITDFGIQAAERLSSRKLKASTAVQMLLTANEHREPLMIGSLIEKTATKFKDFDVAQGLAVAQQITLNSYLQCEGEIKDANNL